MHQCSAVESFGSEIGGGGHHDGGDDGERPAGHAVGGPPDAEIARAEEFERAGGAFLARDFHQHVVDRVVILEHLLVSDVLG